MLEGNIGKKVDGLLSLHVPISGAALTGDLEGVAPLLRLLGEEEVAQDCDRASNVGAVAIEGDECFFGCSFARVENGRGLVLGKKEDRRASLLLGVLGAARLVS